MMNEFKNILVVTDTRLNDHPIVQEAAEITKRNGGKMTVVDVAPDFPWTVRLAMADHDHVHDLIVKEKAESLEAIAAPLRQSGLDVSTKVLEGKSSVEIIREVNRNGHDLVMRIAKGSNSHSDSFFGNTGSRLLRQCPCSVWLVTKNTTPIFKHVLACVDTSSEDETDHELNDRIFKLAAAIRDCHEGRFSCIHAWSIWNEQMLKGRLGQDAFESLEQKTETVVTERMQTFLDAQGEHCAETAIVKGQAEEAITNFAKTNEVDLVVMGTVARSGLAGLVTGNSAEEILSKIQCSILALKPANFVSPIQNEENI